MRLIVNCLCVCYVCLCVGVGLVTPGCGNGTEEWLDLQRSKLPRIPVGAATASIATRCCRKTDTLQCKSQSAAVCLANQSTYQEAVDTCQSLPDDQGGWHLCSREEIAKPGSSGNSSGLCCQDDCDASAYVWTREAEYGATYYVSPPLSH